MKEKRQFKIFADVPPMPDKEHLLKYKKAGFTHYVMTEDYISLRDKDNKVSKDYIDAILLAKKLKLKVLFRTMRESNLNYYDGITNEFKGLCDGYYMCDEPCYEELNWDYESPKIDDLHNFKTWYNKYGEKFFHINLLQSYGVDMLHPKSISYKEYIDKYVSTILKDIKGTKTLATDYYPLAQENGKNFIKDKYLFDLFSISLKAKELKENGEDVRTGFCVQVFVDEGLKLRKLTSRRDISFQTYVLASFGAEHLEYFLYTWDNDGLVPDRKTQKVYDEKYFWAKSVNKEMQKLAKYLLTYKWNNAKLYKGESSLENFADIKKNILGLEVDSFSDINVKSNVDVLVSEFIKDGKKAYMIANFSEPSINASCKAQVELKGFDKVKIFNGGFISRKKVNGEFKVNIPSGKAIFIFKD